MVIASEILNFVLVHSEIPNYSSVLLMLSIFSSSFALLFFLKSVHRRFLGKRFGGVEWRVGVEGKMRMRKRNGKGGPDLFLISALQSENWRIHFGRTHSGCYWPNTQKLKRRMRKWEKWSPKHPLRQFYLVSSNKITISSKNRLWSELMKTGPLNVGPIWALTEQIVLGPLRF